MNGNNIVADTSLLVNFFNGIELAVKLTPEEFKAHVRLMTALKMLELGKISSGKAAEFAGISKVELQKEWRNEWKQFTS